MPNFHFKYGGSTMNRTLNCTGWAKLAETVPPSPLISSDAAELGTALHDAMEYIVENELTPNELEGTLVCKVFNGIPITEEMVRESLEPALNALNSIIEQYDIVEYLVEPLVTFLPDLSGGSIDFFGVSSDGKTAVVVDYKFGFYAVPAEENKQLLFYALAADIDAETAKYLDQVETLSLNIIQPSNASPDNEFGLDQWETPIDRLDTFEEDVMKAIKAAEQGGRLNAGDHCKFCPAMAVCPIKTGIAEKAAKLPTPHVNMLDEWLPILPELELWIKSLKDLAHTALENGTKLKDYKLVNKRATRQWTNLEEVEKKIKLMRGIKGGEQYDMKLKSPAQMEKLFKAKKVDFNKVADYIASVSSGTTMAKASDKRPEALPAEAFKKAMRRLD